MSHQLFGMVIAAILASTVSFPAWADFTGKVVNVADGDSITVLRDREQVKARLVEIDAPEKGQVSRSSENLAPKSFVAPYAHQGGAYGPCRGHHQQQRFHEPKRSSKVAGSGADRQC